MVTALSSIVFFKRQMRISQKTIGLLLVLLLGMSVALFWPTYVSLHSRWINPEEPYTHSYIVIALAAFLVWCQVKTFTNNCSPSWLGILLGFFTTFVWFVGHVAQIQVLSQLALPLIFLSWILAVFGFSVFKVLLLPVLYCYLTIPAWGYLGGVLRTLAVEATSFGLSFTSIPVFIDGFNIHLPAGIVVVAGGCSGQNYLLTGLAVSGFYALHYLSGYQRWLCVGTMLILSLVSNWIRIFILVLIGYYSELQHPLMKDHNGFGWLVFTGALLLFFLLIRYIPVREPIQAMQHSERGQSYVLTRRVSTYIVMGLLLLSQMLMFPFIDFRLSQKQSDETVLATLIPQDTLILNAENAWLPLYRGYDQVQRSVLATQAGQLDVVALIYNEQQQGKELIYDKNMMVELQQIVQQGKVNVAGVDDLSFLDFKVDDQLKRLYWQYRIADWTTVSPKYRFAAYRR